MGHEYQLEKSFANESMNSRNKIVHEKPMIFHLDMIKLIPMVKTYKTYKELISIHIDVFFRVPITH